MSTTNSQAGCERCNKSGLSLLLLRPSPIANDTRLAPVGAHAVVNADGLAEGLVPARKPTESRYVLRMLRAGYVHVYIPSPPPGMKSWLVYRVTDAANLIAQSDPVFSQMPQPPSCRRDGHNVAGMKLLHIPQAHKIGSIWVAYSANLWSDKLKAQNAANPKAMQQVSLQSCGRNSFTPTVEALKSQVLECALSSFKAKGLQDSASEVEQDFPFVSMASQAQSLADNLQRAAACHPKTEGLEMAVVLRDPVGVATELNAIRLRRNDVIEQYLSLPENRHPMEVNKAIKLLKNNLIAKADEEALGRAVPLRTKQAFGQSSYPAGTEWHALTAEEKVVHASKFEQGNWLGKLIARPALNALSADNVGRVILPDYEARVQAWGEQQAEEDWRRFLKFYDEAKRSSWEASFERTVKAQHIDPLVRFEDDWEGALRDPNLLSYFELHFDERSSQYVADVAGQGCCSGSVYIREVSGAFTPEPKTHAAREAFEAQLDADVTKPDALLLRALFANQADLWETVENSKRDKTYDFMKGLIGEFIAAKTESGTKPLSSSVAKRVAWLTQANMGFAVGIVGAITAVAMRGVAEFWEKFEPSASGAAPKIDPKLLNRLRRAESMALIHRACEEALKGGAGGAKIPVLLMANVSVETLVQIKRGRGEMLSIRQIRGLARKGQVTIGILTDTETVAALKAAPDKAMRELASQSSGSVLINEQALNLKGHVLSHGAAAGSMLTLPVSRFLPLYEKQLLEAASAPAQLRAWLSQVLKTAAGSTVARDIRGVSMSIEGRLAIGSMIVQGVGVYYGLMDYMSAPDTDKRTDALLSIADGTAGVLGGAAEFGAKWIELRLGLAAEQSAGLAFARAAAAGMGVAGNLVNAWMCFREAGKLEKAGHKRLSVVMDASQLVFLLGGVPFSLQVAHQLTVLALRRGVVAGGIVLAEQQLGRIVAARLGTAALGLTVPGIGWALTVVAVGQTIYVIVNTPTPVESWLKASYFGKPDSETDRRKTWAEEEKAWNELQTQPAGG